jgi:hypothetical protein
MRRLKSRSAAQRGTCLQHPWFISFFDVERTDHPCDIK